MTGFWKHSTWLAAVVGLAGLWLLDVPVIVGKGNLDNGFWSIPSKQMLHLGLSMAIGAFLFVLVKDIWRLGKRRPQIRGRHHHQGVSIIVPKRAKTEMPCREPTFVARNQGKGPWSKGGTL